MKNRFIFSLVILATASILICSCMLPLHSPNKDYQYELQKFEVFGRQTSRILGLKYLNDGNSTDSSRVQTCLNYSCAQNLTLHQSRILATALAEEYINVIQTDDQIKKRYIKRREDTLANVTLDTILKYAGFRITFWDEEVNRPKAPFISEIQFYAGKFHYYEADPKTQELKLVFEESYDEGIKFKSSVKK